MPAIENVTRRSAVYWWRRRLRLAPASAKPITVVMMVSLLTKDQPVARRRAVAMTGQSETVRMSLYEKIERDGLTADQASAVFQEEMIRYRNMLAYQHQSIQQDGEGHVAERFAQMRAIYSAVNRDFADNGFTDFLGIDYVGGFDRRFADLDDEARGHLYAMLGRTPELPEHLLNEARDLLRCVGVDDSGDRSEAARQIMCQARAAAAASYGDPALQDMANRMAVAATIMRSLGAAAPSPAQIVAPTPAAMSAQTAANVAADPEQWDEEDGEDEKAERQRYARMSPLEVVEAYMSLKPKARGRATVTKAAANKPKSQAKTWADSQRRQFKAAAFLFGKSNGGKPLARTRQEDLNRFYDQLNRMPSTHHKSVRHEPMKIEDICLEAANRVEEAEKHEEAINFTIGLDVGTINRHFANLKKLSTWLASKTKMRVLDFSDYILVEEERDERTERDPYTIQQGQELFALGIWTGSPTLDDRFTKGSDGRIWHDAAYWIMPIVWYSGMRREEACKLLVEDIGEEDGVPYFDIRNTRAGRVKTAKSTRKVPICAELRRLGLLDYVAAMRAAGEEYLFPEIVPGKGGRPLGDVFFNTIWLKIKPLLTLIKPGQAVHSGRHMVSTELKALQTFEETRADLLGQQIGGENAVRYAGATRLEILADVVDRLPIVTGHLPSPETINLLPKHLRCARPTRQSAGRRARG
ncbi:integrase [Sphingomonas sp. SORGH_AS 950]|uniref:integrase n=2 Tax=Sphingomonadaceae TaxID=41297 RepID=UPI002780AD75|nr:integrase [Sphingomonas sp. SORGH_AS_0950]MDQ1156410.1 integrase [Sphingomonas sp. SORGH_AS_0950]